jgi:hypothetical protein
MLFVVQFVLHGSLVGRDNVNNRRQINGDQAGAVHLPGISELDAQTFCGHNWNFVEGTREHIQYQDTEDSVSCLSCIRAATEAKEILRGWKPWYSKS